jgi:hypothetical protein
VAVARGSEDVEGDPRRRGDQPAGEVADRRQVAALQPEPGLLDGVLGLGERPEQAVRDAGQPGPQLLEQSRGVLG